MILLYVDRLSSSFPGLTGNTRAISLNSSHIHMFYLRLHCRSHSEGALLKLVIRASATPWSRWFFRAQKSPRSVTGSQNEKWRETLSVLSTQQCLPRRDDPSSASPLPNTLMSVLLFECDRTVNLLNTKGLRHMPIVNRHEFDGVCSFSNASRSLQASTHKPVSLLSCWLCSAHTSNPLEDSRNLPPFSVPFYTTLISPKAF